MATINQDGVVVIMDRTIGFVTQDIIILKSCKLLKTIITRKRGIKWKI